MLGFRALILEFKPRLGNRCGVLPVYALLRALILDFRPRLGNRCIDSRDFRGFRASILDFRPRLGNRCGVLPVYALFRALILEFRPRLPPFSSTPVPMIVTTPSYEMVYLYLLFMTPRLTILPLFLSHTLFLFVFIITKFSQINPAC